jgi:hypothetical protein
MMSGAAQQADGADGVGSLASLGSRPRSTSADRWAAGRCAEEGQDQHPARRLWASKVRAAGGGEVEVGRWRRASKGGQMKLDSSRTFRYGTRMNNYQCFSNVFHALLLGLASVGCSGAQIPVDGVEAGDVFPPVEGYLKLQTPDPTIKPGAVVFFKQDNKPSEAGRETKCASPSDIKEDTAKYQSSGETSAKQTAALKAKFLAVLGIDASHATWEKFDLQATVRAAPVGYEDTALQQTACKTTISGFLKNVWNREQHSGPPEFRAVTKVIEFKYSFDMKSSTSISADATIKLTSFDGNLHAALADDRHISGSSDGLVMYYAINSHALKPEP